MIDEKALEQANNRQTEKAFSITNALCDKGYPSAVGGGCARRYVGWCQWMNDADMLSTASHEIVIEVFKTRGLNILAHHEHSVAGFDEDGIYEMCCWKEHGEDTSVFSRHPMNWRFEHRALALDARTRRPIEQPDGVRNLKQITARIDPENLFSWDPYMCYLGLSHACREDLPFDERLMDLMRQKPHVNFFMGLFFKLLSKVLIGKAPSRGMDRLLEANVLYYLPGIQEAWRSASVGLRSALDECSDWIQPWMLLMKENPAIKQDLMRIYFPEQWLTYYEHRPVIVFPILEDTLRRRESWTYWHIRKMMRDLIYPPEFIKKSPKITDRVTPWPFP